MPATSNKQKQFMDAAAHNPQFAKAAGVPVSVAKEFSGASKGMKFGKDTNKSRPDLQKVNKPKTLHGKMSIMKEGGNTMASKMNPGMMAIMAKKKGATKMANGGAMRMKDGKPAFIGDGKGMKKGGAVYNDDREPGSSGGMGGDRVPSGQGEKRGGLMKAKKMNMGGMSNGGSASKRADGIAIKGKTKGKMLKSGGKAC